MSHLFSLDQEHLKRIQQLFSRPRGVARIDDRKVLSGIIQVIRNGLRGRDAPSDHRPHKTLNNRFVGLSGMGAFDDLLGRFTPSSGYLSHLPLLSGYDEPRALSYQITLVGHIGADVRHC